MTSLTFSKLKTLTDDQIVEKYDAAAVHLQVGTGFWLDELNRRAYQRATDAALAEASAARKLAKINMWVAIVAIVASIGTGVLQIVLA